MKKITFNILAALLLAFMIFNLTAPGAAAASMFEKLETGVKTMVNSAYGGDPQANVDITKNTFLNSLIIIINTLLSFIGVVFFLLLAYSGYLWMTAHGNEEQVKKAKEMMKEIVIALVIIFTARIFTEFLLTQIGAIISANNQAAK